MYSEFKILNSTLIASARDKLLKYNENILKQIVMGSEKRIPYYKEIIGSCKMNQHKPYEWLVFIQAKC